MRLGDLLSLAPAGISTAAEMGDVKVEATGRDPNLRLLLRLCLATGPEAAGG